MEEDDQDKEWGFKPIGGLILGALIFAALIYGGKAFGSGEVFQKARLSEEIALAIDAMLATNGYGYIFYPSDLSKFSFDIKDRVSVYKFDNDPSLTSYGYVKTSDVILDTVLINPVNMIVAKVAYGIIISEDNVNLDKRNCPDIETRSTMGDDVLLIDPGHGDGTGLRKGGLDESAITSSIATSFNIAASGKFKEIKHTRSGDLGLGSTRLDSHEINNIVDESDIVVSIHAGDYFDDRQILKIYYPYSIDPYTDERNKKLACLVLNRIVDLWDLHLMGANIIPRDPGDMPKYEQAILIEIGNMNIQKDKNSLAMPDLLSSIGRSVYEGVADYYET